MAHRHIPARPYTRWTIADVAAPSLFENTGNDGIIDEWTFGQYQDYNTARNALVNHWNSWITEGDIAQIAGTSKRPLLTPTGPKTLHHGSL